LWIAEASSIRVFQRLRAPAEEIAAARVRELARGIERLNLRIADLEDRVGVLLERHGNPVEDLHGAERPSPQP